MTIEAAEQLEGLRQIGRIVDQVLGEMQQRTQAGMTTADLDAVGGEALARHGAESSPRKVYGFPGTACISVNDEIVHGVPGRRVIQPGDIVKIDLTADRDGYVADATRIVLVPPATDLLTRLADCARSCFGQALKVAHPGSRLREIGRSIEREAHRCGFTVVHELAGHGVGRTIHEDPVVPNFDDPLATGRLIEGLVITIEPMVNAGTRHIKHGRDKWTVLTADGQPSAHFEQTVLITRNEPVILTVA